MCHSLIWKCCLTRGSGHRCFSCSKWEPSVPVGCVYSPLPSVLSSILTFLIPHLCLSCSCQFRTPSSVISLHIWTVSEFCIVSIDSIQMNTSDLSSWFVILGCWFKRWCLDSPESFESMVWNTAPEIWLIFCFVMFLGHTFWYCAQESILTGPMGPYCRSESHMEARNWTWVSPIQVLHHQCLHNLSWYAYAFVHNNEEMTAYYWTFA